LAASALLLTGCTGEADDDIEVAERWDFHTRPDLGPPKVDIDSGEFPDDNGNLETFLAPKGQTKTDDKSWGGGLILDAAGGRISRARRERHRLVPAPGERPGGHGRRTAQGQLGSARDDDHR